MSSVGVDVGVLAPPPSKKGDPAWDIALLFPPQWQWSDEEYFSLEKRSSRLVELRDGCIEVLPMPTPEYWIVDPHLRQITVLVLESGAYRVHGVFGSGETATSVLLAGFSIGVSEAFAVSA